MHNLNGKQVINGIERKHVNKSDFLADIINEVVMHQRVETEPTTSPYRHARTLEPNYLVAPRTRVRGL